MGNVERSESGCAVSSAAEQREKMEALGKLAGGIAHDFNNILMIIDGHARVVLDKIPADAPERVCLESIRKAVMRGSELTGRLLDVGGRGAQDEVIDVAAFVQEQVDILKPYVQERAQLFLDFEEGLYVKGARDSLARILINLVMNACEAGQEDAQNTIKVFAKKRGSSFVCMQVVDDGAGMDAETKSHIFDPFYTTKGPGKGTGLGLSIVEGVVTRMGGHIDVESETGQGTTISICLPLLTSSEKSLLRDGLS
ncbi:MAG: HAMP domain-containing histidine kinase [Rhodospirillales bacterium]|nr:HAMP domain-containing histidine kinase [Rhodospirillales bacterium]